jgi:hypothetical protein
MRAALPVQAQVYLVQLARQVVTLELTRVDMESAQTLEAILEQVRMHLA